MRQLLFLFMVLITLKTAVAVDYISMSDRHMARYSFDTNISDEKNGYNWTSGGAVIITENKLFGDGAINFSDNYVNMTDELFGNLSKVNRSFSLHVYFNSIAGGEQKIFSRQGGSQGMWMLSQDSNLDETINFCIWDGGAYQCLNSSVGVNSGEWYHIGVVKNVENATAQLYINGSLHSSISGLLNSTPLSNVTFMGRRSTGALDYFYGSVDELNVWNRTLDADEVLWSSQYSMAELSIVSIISVSAVPDDDTEPYDVNSDFTPTFNITSSTEANCMISDDNRSWINGTTTGGIKHVVTLNTTQALSRVWDLVYVNCTIIGGGATVYDELSVYLNEPPVCEINFSRIDNYAGNDLVVVANWSDLNSVPEDNGSLGVEWFVNGSFVHVENVSVSGNSSVNFSLSPSNFSKDSVIIAQCIAVDNSTALNNISYLNVSTIINNSFPSPIIVFPVLYARVNGNFTMLWNEGADSDGENVTYQISFNGSALVNTTNLNYSFVSANFSVGIVNVTIIGFDSNNSNQSNDLLLTIDITRPVVTYLLNYSAGINYFSINWSCDELCNYTLLYDTEVSSLDFTKSDGGLRESFDINVTGLSSGSDYYWRLYVFDNVSGVINVFVSGTYNLTTLTAGVVISGGGGGGRGVTEVTFLLGNFSVVPLRISTIVLGDFFRKNVESKRIILGCSSDVFGCDVLSDGLGVVVSKDFSNQTVFSQTYFGSVVLNDGVEFVRVPVRVVRLRFSKIILIGISLFVGGLLFFFRKRIRWRKIVVIR